ncbi:unnamed protein product [Sphenostylis stenocarpa]|uniref:Uncharacterized protein n=1 Tax=Sphenostylis stenocarpa TaxID=92480 RepID=A0AA86T3G0_9FABA|nr:unnamed protein product [Sphenostylis stenocarpa]
MSVKPALFATNVDVIICSNDPSSWTHRRKRIYPERYQLHKLGILINHACLFSTINKSLGHSSVVLSLQLVRVRKISRKAYKCSAASREAFRYLYTHTYHDRICLRAINYAAPITLVERLTKQRNNIQQ